jgi:hypothetical protein
LACCLKVAGQSFTVMSVKVCPASLDKALSIFALDNYGLSGDMSISMPASWSIFSISPRGNSLIAVSALDKYGLFCQKEANNNLVRF